ncbi:MAG TPA: MiaB/RimO family radical SAM methylthiotransferase, partial [Nitrospirae bacterium]|nr:MiaB/RimO family radical SAM methylthiotransferase [Nitrospirota bacterium]
MRISLQSLGCKVNQAEILDLEHALRRGGHELVGLAERPDVCVVNTCTVTAKSDYQSRQLIRRAARTGGRVIVTGCYSQMNQDRVREMDNVHHVVSNTDKDKIISYIDDKLKVINDPGSRSSRTRYFLKVQDGCSNSCSYCLVWKARGKSRSIALGEAVKRARAAVEAGYKEIVLSGVHLGLYGHDLLPQVSLADLMEEILLKTKVPRIRLSSLEINEITPRILKLLGDSRVCSHLHVPLQSGDSGVLGQMRRNYDMEGFRDRVLEISSQLGETLALGTDIIAGFPTETDEAFDNSLALASELPFTYMHVFPYSSRPGTQACGLEDIVGQNKRVARASMLRDLAAWKKESYMRTQDGRILEVLFEKRLR